MDERENLTTKGSFPIYAVTTIHRKTPHGTLEYLLAGGTHPPAFENLERFSVDGDQIDVEFLIAKKCEALFSDYITDESNFTRLLKVLLLINLRLEKATLLEGMDALEWVEFADEDAFHDMWAKQICTSINERGEYPLAIICPGGCTASHIPETESSS